MGEKAPVSREVPSDLDPAGVFQQNRSPEGYRYVYGMFWENGKDMKRPDDDPDRHAFGFVFVKKSAGLSDQEVEEERNRYKPIPVPAGPETIPISGLKRVSSLSSSWACMSPMGREARLELRCSDEFGMVSGLASGDSGFFIDQP